VFYELGVRHRARQSGTAILRQVQFEDKLPFDISHVKAFPYRYSPEEDAAKAREDITKLLTKSVAEDRTDNIIQLVLKQETEAPLRRSAAGGRGSDTQRGSGKSDPDVP
jgi:hypothetical protein